MPISIKIAVEFALFESTQNSENEDIKEADLKFRAGMLLADQSKNIIVPTYDEWVGLNMMDRDSEIKRKPKTRSNNMDHL